MSPQWFGPCAAPVQKVQCLDDLQGVFSYKCWGSAWHNRNHRPILRHRSKLIPAWTKIAYMALRMVFIPVQHGCHWKPSWWLRISTFKAILRVFFFFGHPFFVPIHFAAYPGVLGTANPPGKAFLQVVRTCRLERFGDIDICHKIGDPREDVDGSSTSTSKGSGFGSPSEDIREIRESHEIYIVCVFICRLGYNFIWFLLLWPYLLLVLDGS